jgi:hypothetical protein
MAGDAVGVGVVGVMATMVVEAGVTDAGSLVDVATLPDAATLVGAGLSADADLRVVRLAASTVQWAADFTVVVAADSMVVVVGSTAAAADTAVVATGNPRIRGF